MIVKLYYIWIFWSIHVLFLIQPRGTEDQVNLTVSPILVTEHDPQTFICKYNGNKNILSMGWRKDGISFATFVIESGHCTKFKEPDYTLYSHNCSVSTNTYMLTIRTVTKQNTTSSWICSIFIAGSDTTTSSNLVSPNIKVPITSVSMTEPQVSTTVPVHENTTAVFKCVTSGGLPEPSVKWYKDSKTQSSKLDDVDITSSATSNTAVLDDGLIEARSTLRYMPTRYDNGMRIYCTANIGGQSPLSSTLQPQLNVQYPPDKPPVIINYTSEYRVIEKTQGQLICSISGGNPVANLTWSCFTDGILGNRGTDTVTRMVTWTAQQGQDRTCVCHSSHFNWRADVSVDVKVLYPPSKPTFWIRSTSVSGTVNVIKNNALSVTCNSSGNPSPSYKWTHLSNTIRRVPLLDVHSVQNDGTYTCRVQNVMNPSQGNPVNGSNSLAIDVHMLYPPTIGDLKNTSIVEGSPVTVSCPVTAGYPPKTSYKWIRNGTVWKNTQTFAIDTVSRNDAMSYTCEVSNSMVQTGEGPVSQPDMKSFYLNVLYEATITSFFIEGHRGQTHVTVDENDGDIQFACEVDSNPSATVKIMFDGEILKERSNTKHISLIHSSVACLDGGEYKCEGSNQYGLSKKSIKLFVNCSPRPLHQVRQNITSALHVPVTLGFTALAYPYPGTKGFVWSKESGVTWTPVLSNADLQISSSASQSNLTILNVSKTDYGRYRLTVTNSLGSYVQYLFLEEDVVNGGLPETCARYCKIESENTALITGISLGVVVATLAIYAASITILYKRKTTQKDQQSVVGEFTGKTYMNVAFNPNVPENRNNDGVEGEVARQYTDLADYSRDNSTTYEVLHNL